ncbi:MAG: DUF5052 family protein [Negativicutes bacterium]|nr:DUF5052 family protein [Negativicutes bacterium]
MGSPTRVVLIREERRILKKIVVGVIVLVGLVALSSCVAFNDLGKDWESDTKGLQRVITVYSKTGEVLETFEGNNVRISVDESGQVKINFDGKRTQVLNADVIIKEK